MEVDPELIRPTDRPLLTKEFKRMRQFEGEPFLYENFPKNFSWAVATASYQIEGAWNEDGKGPSIWDTFTHTPGNVADGTNGDIACDSYHKWARDVDMLKELGVSHYRFSISWSRVLPKGTGEVNEKGLHWYGNLVHALRRAGITPMVTLYHWDLPQALEDEGGWLNENSPDWFLEYADVVFKNLSHHVDQWITFNEPHVFAKLGYGEGIFAPGKKSPQTYPYIVGHNVLKAHAKAYRLFKDKYAKKNDRIGISLNLIFHLPESDDQGTVDSAERRNVFEFGWFADPIFHNGDYPKIMREMEKPNLFSQLNSPLNAGSADFVGLNFYTARLCRHLPPGAVKLDKKTRPSDSDSMCYSDPSRQTAASSWLKVIPHSIRLALNWIKERYGDIPVVITENGYSDSGDLRVEHGKPADPKRIEYLNHYINNVLKGMPRKQRQTNAVKMASNAIKLDGCNVQGYTLWTLMDNFEWAEGYRERFGLYQVDFKDQDLPRRPKASAHWYKEFIKQGGFKQSHSQMKSIHSEIKK
ncbi:unnamed protein product [Cyprideis torosa]|nr:unnamed protein product [Cyprideis torosa]CAG0889688.1 unnamed protein product [Cyprideis torosa]